MSEGAWVAVSVAAAGGFGTVIAAIIRFVPRTNGSATVDSSKCPAHSGLVAEIQAVRRGVDEIRTDVKQLISRR